MAKEEDSHLSKIASPFIYVLDFSKIQTLEDVITVLKSINIQFSEDWVKEHNLENFVKIKEE